VKRPQRSDIALAIFCVLVAVVFTLAWLLAFRMGGVYP